MRVAAHAGFVLNLSDEERFEITGKAYYLGPESTILVDLVEPRESSTMVELTGAMRKQDGEFGATRRRVRVRASDELLPQAIRDEITRCTAHAERFISKVQSR